MGGGAAMRSAAKAVGLGVIASSYKGGTPLAERIFTSRNSVTSFPPIIVSSSSTNEVKNSTISSQNHISSMQTPFWETENCELMSGNELMEEEEEGILNRMDQAPLRLVSGAVPSPKEAKEATSDLKDALDLIYFSSSSTATTSDSSCTKVQETTSHGLSGLEDSGIKAGVDTEDGVIIQPKPINVYRAFSVLRNCSDIQDVVASVASDKNVWEAVMKNKEVMEFCKSKIKDLKESTAGTKGDGSLKNGSDDEKSSGSSENGSVGFMQTIKLKVIAIVGNLSELLQQVFGNPVEESSPENTIRKSTSTGTCLVALAMAVIMVIMVKRG